MKATQTATLYEIEAQVKGKYRTRWNVCHEHLPTFDRETAEMLIRMFTTDRGYYEYRLVAIPTLRPAYGEWQSNGKTA